MKKLTQMRIIIILLSINLKYLGGLTYKYFILNFYMGTKMPFVAMLLSCFPLDIPGDIVLCIRASLVGSKLSKYAKRENVNYA